MSEDLFKELKKTFIDEAFEQLSMISNLLFQIEDDKENLEEYIKEMFRLAHTIKGDANVVGFDDIGNIAHEMESHLSKIRDNPDSFKEDDVDLLFNYVNDINTLVQYFASESSENTETDTETIDSEINQTSIFDEGISLDDSPQQKTTNDKESELSLESIRVSTDKVDKIINLSGELLVNKISYFQRMSELKNLYFNMQKYRLSEKKKKFLDTDLVSFKNERKQLFKQLLDFEENILDLFKNFRKDNLRFSYTTDELQFNSRNIRMVKVKTLIDNIKVLVRNTSKKKNKLVDLNISGEEIEIDKFLIEKLKAPISHLIRNAIDHGIEEPDVRLNKGKPERGNINVNVSISGNNVLFSMQDNGKGINYGAIKEKALNLNLITKDQADKMSLDEMKKLIFLSGFSTKESIDDISGRGVGLDVVRQMVNELNGSLSVNSEIEVGTTFHLVFPLTLTTFEGFLVKEAGQLFAILKSSVESTIFVKKENIIESTIKPMILYKDKPIRIIRLCDILNIPSKVKNSDLMALILKNQYTEIAVIVDDILEDREMILKSLGSQLKNVSNILGATILGDGKPVIIINTSEIFNSYSYENIAVENISKIEDIKQKKLEKRKKTKILVVDDSVTTRTLEKNTLEFAGFDVILANDGLEGKSKAEEFNPSLIVTDLEMPKMNGLEMSKFLKSSEKYKHIPIIMITSRNEKEFVDHANEIGIDRYLIKANFDQKKLLKTIEDLLP